MSLIKVEAGCYRTPDGEYLVIRQDDSEYYCDAPHGKCWGNQPHPDIYWLVFSRIGQTEDYEPDEGFDTLREARAYLERKASRLALN